MADLEKMKKVLPQLGEHNIMSMLKLIGILTEEISSLVKEELSEGVMGIHQESQKCESHGTCGCTRKYYRA